MLLYEVSCLIETHDTRYLLRFIRHNTGQLTRSWLDATLYKMKIDHSFTTREATPLDSVAIAQIYNQGIADRIATFEIALRTPADIERWFDGIHPVVVVERDMEVVAFAATSTYRPRACYASNAEFSVYVDRSARGLGAGYIAMQALISAARAAGFTKLISRVFVENSASRSMLQKSGFREVGIYEKHGQLDGVWRDVVIVELLLEYVDNVASR